MRAPVTPRAGPSTVSSWTTSAALKACPSRAPLRQGGAGAPVGAPARAGSLWSECESGAGGHHRCAARAHGRDDLLGVDPLQIDRSGAEIQMPQLPLDDVQRHPLAGELERMRVPQLVRSEPAPDTRPGRDPPELGADRGTRPRPPAGWAVDHAEQRPDG